MCSRPTIHALDCKQSVDLVRLADLGIVVAVCDYGAAFLVGGPFNSFLAEKVEQLETGREPNPDEGLFDSIKDIPHSIKRQLVIIGYSMPRVIVFLLLYLVPGVNIATSVLWFLFSAWIMALQYVDYPMDLHRVPFSQMCASLLQCCKKEPIFLNKD